MSEKDDQFLRDLKRKSKDVVPDASWSFDLCTPKEDFVFRFVTPLVKIRDIDESQTYEWTVNPSYQAVVVDFRTEKALSVLFSRSQVQQIEQVSRDPEWGDIMRWKWRLQKLHNGHIEVRPGPKPLF